MGGITARPRANKLRVPALVCVVAVSGLVAVTAPLDGRADATTATCATVNNVLGPATGWTEFIEGNANRHDSESEGLAAYGGNLGNNGNWNQVGFKYNKETFDATRPALVVGGIKTAKVHLAVGSAYVKTESGTTEFQGGGKYLAGSPIDFAAAFTELRALSTTWGAATQTGTVAEGGDSANHRLVLTGTNADLNVFNISAAQVAWASAAIRIDVKANSTTIINVSGTSVAFGGSTQKIEALIGGSFQGLDDGNFANFTGLVWNFPEATSISLNNGGAFAGAMLAPRAAITVGDSVGHNTGQVIAKSFDSNRETHLPLFQSTSCVPATPPSTSTKSDMTITKSASTATPAGGGTFTYTLTATNGGTADATGVVMRDELPSGVTLVTPLPTGCSAVGAVVTCSVGALVPNASASVTLTVTAKPVAGAGPITQTGDEHWMTPYHPEAQVDLWGVNDQRSVTLSCNDGDILSDGDFRVDHVDQGTGTFSDVKVLSSQSIGMGTWKGVIRNQTTGHVQAKAFIVCLPGTTAGGANGHRHSLLADNELLTSSAGLQPGRSTMSLTCRAGTVPIVPGYELSLPSAALVASEADLAARTWTFTFDASSAVTAAISVRCLSATTSAVDGHTHQLQVDHVIRTVSVPGDTPAEGTEYKVSCADDAKGVVGTFDLPDGVTTWGNDPRIKERAFRLFNRSGAPRTATLDLVCVHDRTITGMGTTVPVSVVNTATVSSTSPDSNAANNAASATVEVQPGTTTATSSGRIAVSGARLSVGVLSSMPGTGAVKVTSGGAVLAKGDVRLKAGGAVKASVRLTRAGKRKIRALTTVRVRIDPSRGPAVTRTVRVSR